MSDTAQWGELRSFVHKKTYDPYTLANLMEDIEDKPSALHYTLELWRCPPDWDMHALEIAHAFTALLGYSMEQLLEKGDYVGYINAMFEYCGRHLCESPYCFLEPFEEISEELISHVKDDAGPWKARIDFRELSLAMDDVDEDLFDEIIEQKESFTFNEQLLEALNDLDDPEFMEKVRTTPKLLVDVVTFVKLSHLLDEKIMARVPFVELEAHLSDITLYEALKLLFGISPEGYALEQCQGNEPVDPDYEDAFDEIQNEDLAEYFEVFFGEEGRASYAFGHGNWGENNQNNPDLKGLTRIAYIYDTETSGYERTVCKKN